MSWELVETANFKSCLNIIFWFKRWQKLAQRHITLLLHDNDALEWCHSWYKQNNSLLLHGWLVWLYRQINWPELYIQININVTIISAFQASNLYIYFLLLNYFSSALTIDINGKVIFIWQKSLYVSRVVK